MPAAAVDVVMLQEHGCWKYDVCELRRVRHELLMDADKKIIAQKAALHQPLFRRDIGGIRVLDQHGGDRRTAMKGVRIARQHRADPGLVERTYRWIGKGRALDQRLVEAEDAGIGMECA